MFDPCLPFFIARHYAPVDKSVFLQYHAILEDRAVMNGCAVSN
jgi:hypothetical protein